VADIRRSLRLLAGALAALAIAGIAVAWSIAEVGDRRALTEKDRQEVASITANMKPLCVGRFVIDLPADAETALTMANVDGLSIVTGLESRTDFQKRLAAREAEVRAIPDQSGGDRNLESAIAVNTASGLSGKILVHSRVLSVGTQARGLEIEHYRYEGVAVDALVHGNGVSIDLAADNYEPERANQLAQLITRLVPNPDNRIPAASGFCIDNAYFDGLLLPDQGERIMMRARLTSHPDVEFTLMLAAGTAPDAKGLLDRTAESQGQMIFAESARLTTLRAGRRAISGLVGEEVAERIVENDMLVLHHFWWEVNGTADDVLNPHVSFTMVTGASAQKPMPAPLSEPVTISLWDWISSSIRLLPSESRPGSRRTES